MSAIKKFISSCCINIKNIFTNTNTRNDFDNTIFPNSNDNLNKYKITPIIVINFNKRNIREQLGKGGSAIVYKYIDNNIEYACKKQPSSIRAIEREINIMKSYKHNRYLPTYFDSYINSENNLQNAMRYHYILMEHCKGVELFEQIKPNFDCTLATNIIYQVVSAVNHLQKYKIIHCDIKLENIIINSNNQIKLIDFVLSRILPENSSCIRQSRYTGTVGYVSPESIIFNYITLKTDIWSIGILYYILLNNSHVFNVVNIYNYKKQLCCINSVIKQNNCFIVDNNTEKDFAVKQNMILFFKNTICYDKHRFTIRDCLHSNIFKNMIYI